MEKRELSGRIAVVTGAGRRRGIGTAICRALADKGADIFFVWHPHDRRMREEGDDPAELEEELRSKGVRAEGFAMDLSSPSAPEAVLDRVEERLRTPSILVNNAAHSTTDGVDGLDAVTLDAHYAVNVRAAVLLSVGFARRWKGKRGGRIINLTSGQSLGPMPGEIAYATTKGAIEAFTSTFAVEVASRGITVNAVNPGPTDTGWMTEELKRELLSRFPTGRLGQPEDAARLIAFLAGEEAEWITGQVIHSEGGFWRR
ncbi:3-oxoacyl-[acyl-carrier protein] reductase [Planifilum fulgidum]|uniref:3-oxoacyl-[acyl-carrier protein] reductase n=2 Tax=Planifilum fulgidum TaxID=201973 RepID=A0A1I2KZV2_9BACL|nr:3-oxoacyl-[acyl-carrier protein] reductase [Planifilum fulgidum]